MDRAIIDRDVEVALQHNGQKGIGDGLAGGRVDGEDGCRAAEIDGMVSRPAERKIQSEGGCWGIETKNVHRRIHGARRLAVPEIICCVCVQDSRQVAQGPGIRGPQESRGQGHR